LFASNETLARLPVFKADAVYTPNLHFSISGFRDYRKLRGLKIEASTFPAEEGRVGSLPNLRAEQGLFLASK
jgi:hypothetical protein